MNLLKNPHWATILILSCFLIVSCKTAGKGAFADRIMPAPTNGGLAMEGYWIWGSCVIKGDEGKYHMFADRWSQKLGFGHWVTSTEIIHAISDTPTGPYQFFDVVMSSRGSQYFDGMSTMNPRVIKFDGKYYMYYVGTTYDYPQPVPGCEMEEGWFEKAWVNKRIGVAVSESLYGPWERMDRPVIEPRPGCWDATITSNPSPVVNERTGKVLLLYKSSRISSQPPLLLGVAEADHPQGNYRRLSDNPIFQFDTELTTDNDVEDPFVWWSGNCYELIMKDRFGHICGEAGGGIHALSENGVEWRLSDPVKAYSRKIRWDNGNVTEQANFERPFLLMENGKPAYLFAATGTGPKAWNFEKTWNMVVPLNAE